MAHKKGQGSTRNGRDSNPQYRGVKRFGGEQVQTGTIIVRQVGTVFHPGLNVGIGRDDTLFAMADGTVHFGSRRRVSVVPAKAAETGVAAEAGASAPQDLAGHPHPGLAGDPHPG